jgi:hypothetical protein
MEGECKKMQKEAEEDFGDGVMARSVETVQHSVIKKGKVV